MSHTVSMEESNLGLGVILPSLFPPHPHPTPRLTQQKTAGLLCKPQHIMCASTRQNACCVQRRRVRGGLNLQPCSFWQSHDWPDPLTHGRTDHKQRHVLGPSYATTRVDTRVKLLKKKKIRLKLVVVLSSG